MERIFFEKSTILKMLFNNPSLSLQQQWRIRMPVSQCKRRLGGLETFVALVDSLSKRSNESTH